ncbi:hypothetical protein, partial [Methanoculleus sp.]|uniref:hypothetical protein n=1 Tax=Methanoculleus sp. TaxID=90427 RepID=UPI00261ACABC
MNDGKLTIDLSGVGNDIPTKLGKSRPTLTAFRGEDYQKALDLNFKLGSDLYEHYDYSTALELLDRAKISAE